MLAFSRTASQYVVSRPRVPGTAGAEACRQLVAARERSETSLNRQGLARSPARKEAVSAAHRRMEPRPPQEVGSS